MARMGRWGRQLYSLLFKASVADEVDTEVAFHVDMRARELEAQGHSADEARRLAQVRLGDIEHMKRDMRSLGEARERSFVRRESFSEFGQDIRFSLRQMLRAPAFTFMAVGTLALGIAGTTSIFSAVRAVVLRPWPWAHPDRTVSVAESWRGQTGSFSAGNFTDLTAAARSYEAIAAEQFANFALGDGDTPERVLGGKVTRDFFRVFGIPPLHGRVIQPEEDSPGAEFVVVLGEALWRRRFGGDPAVIGRPIRMNGAAYTVIGIMPARFDPTVSGEQLWTPVAFTPERAATHDEHYLQIVGLLAPGVTVSQASQEAHSIMADLARRFPQDNNERTADVMPLSELIVGTVGTQLWVLLGAVSLVLLIACGNVANLLLARGAARAREIAVRAAIGAGRGRIVRQLLTESLVLSLLAATAGVMIASGLIRVLVAAAPAGTFPRLDQTSIDGAVLAFALLAALASTVVSGLLPAFRMARHQLQSSLRGGQDGRARDRLRGMLISAEVALSLTLLVGAGLLVKSAVRLQRTPTGMDPAGVVSGRLALPRGAWGDGERVAAAFEQVVADVQRAPGIQSAAAASVSPLSGSGNDNGLIPEGRPLEPASAIQSSMRLVTPDYFAVVGVRLVAGRLFTEQDRAGAPRVMIISETLARQAFPGQDALGKRIVCCEGSDTDPMWKTVIGVAADVRSSGPVVEPRPEFYLPMQQAPHAAWTWIDNTMTIVARSTSDVSNVVGAIRAAVGRLDPSLPLYNIRTAREALALTLAPSRFNTILLSTLAALGFALALAGIYSVIAYFVTLRTREIGVRMALGAQTHDVLRLLVGQGARPVGLGLILGLLGAFASTRFLSGTLYGVAPTDPLTFGVVVGLFVVVALTAIVIPARRAARIEPMQALRDG